MPRSPRGDYGVDAPSALTGLVVGAVSSVVITVVAFAVGWRVLGAILAVGAVYTICSAGTFAHTTLRGKFRVWQEELDALGLRGTESTLDLGCGRGMVVVLTLLRLPGGHGTGIDLWRARDQSGNARAATQANADANHVGGRLELITGDMRALPFPDATFDLVTTALAVHNLPSGPERAAAVGEALRVLRPGGRLLLADFRHVRTYANILKELGVRDVTVRGLGWRYWYGGPWFATGMVSATKA
jgi:SAM-dependent methyltransferase